jgi:hypothetical protein
MEAVSWADRVKNEALHRIKGERNIVRILKLRKANWISHTLLRKCLLKHLLEVKMERKKRRGRTRQNLLHELNEKGRYCNLKNEALYRILWRSRFGRDYGPVARETTLYRTAFTVWPF